jgi:hypothetical protein
MVTFKELKREVDENSTRSRHCDEESSFTATVSLLKWEGEGT